jgi:hypothetical protein
MGCFGNSLVPRHTSCDGERRDAKSEDSSGVSRCAVETPVLSDLCCSCPSTLRASSRSRVDRHRLRKGSKMGLIKSRAASLPPEWNGLLDGLKCLDMLRASKGTEQTPVILMSAAPPQGVRSRTDLVLASEAIRDGHLTLPDQTPPV